MSLTASSVWLSTLDRLDQNGKSFPPRNMLTIEELDVTTRVSMRYPVVGVYERKLSYRFMCAEALWMLEGSCLLEPLLPHAPSMAKYSDDGRTLQGAYGPKIVQQMQYCVDALVVDPNTRQAVIGIWRENPRISRDIPCTLSLQFLIRDNQIHCMASMRSSDIWLGWPYDVFSFSMVTTYLALMYRERTAASIDLGMLSIRAGSQHIYVEQSDKAMAIIKNRAVAQLEILPHEMSHFSSPRDLLDCLRFIRDADNDAPVPPMFSSLRTLCEK